MCADRPLPLISGCSGWFSNCNGFYPISSLLSERNRTQNLPPVAHTRAHTHWCTHTWPVRLWGERPDGNSQVNMFFCRYLLFACVDAFNAALSLIFPLPFSLFTLCCRSSLSTRFCSRPTANMLSFLWMFKEAPAWVWPTQVRLFCVFFSFFIALLLSGKELSKCVRRYDGAADRFNAPYGEVSLSVNWDVAGAVRCFFFPLPPIFFF